MSIENRVQLVSSMAEILPTTCAGTASDCVDFGGIRPVAHRSTTYNDVRLVLIYDDELLTQSAELTNPYSQF